MFIISEMLKNTSPNKKHFISVKHFCAMSRLFIRADLSLELSIYCSLQTLVSYQHAHGGTSEAPSPSKWQRTLQRGLEILRLLISLMNKPGLSVVKVVFLPKTFTIESPRLGLWHHTVHAAACSLWRWSWWCVPSVPPIGRGYCSKCAGVCL